MATATCLWAWGGPRPFWFTATPLLFSASLLPQVMPMPDFALMTIAPVSAGAWKLVTAGVPGAHGYVSVDPGATWAGIRTMLIALSATAAVIDICRLQPQRRIMLWALAASGGLVLLVGLIGGRLGPDYRMLGLIDVAGPFYPAQSPIILPTQSTGVGVADFVNVAGQRYNADARFIGGCVGLFRYANHFAAAVCITLPFLFSVWLRETNARMPTWIQWAVIVTVGAAASWGVAITAESRAGTAAWLLTILTFLSLVLSAPRLRFIAGSAAVVTAIAITGFLLVILLPSETVLKYVPLDLQAPLERLLVAGRAGPARVAVRAFAASPFLGTGLDTFRYVFPKFFTARETLFYAHNEFAQVLAETGALGLTWLTILTWYLVPKALRFWRDAPVPYRLLNAGPWASLVGITAHSAFDWNLHLPANALLICIVIGLAASSVPARNPRVSPRLSIPEVLPRWLLVGFCFLALVLLFRDAISETVQLELRKAIVADRLAKKASARPPAKAALATAFKNAEVMARWDSGNSSLMASLGQVQLHLAAHTPDAQDRAKLLETAGHWFDRARHASALCRGLPEPTATPRN